MGSARQLDPGRSGIYTRCVHDCVLCVSRQGQNKAWRQSSHTFWLVNAQLSKKISLFLENFANLNSKYW